MYPSRVSEQTFFLEAMKENAGFQFIKQTLNNGLFAKDITFETISQPRNTMEL